jgi:heme exporter protein CcmB
MRPQDPGSLAQLARVVGLIVRKDLTIEMRSREILFTTAFFAMSCVLVFAFGFVKDGQAIDDVAAAIHWIAISFSGTLALGRTFERERTNETLQALMLAPSDRPAIYLGKLIGVLVLLFVVEALLVPLVTCCSRCRCSTIPGCCSADAFGTLGFASVGTLFAAMLVRARSRDVLLPVLLYPITIPVIIAGVKGTAALAQPGGDVSARAWMAMLVFFDAVFVTLALWTFEAVMTE